MRYILLIVALGFVTLVSQMGFEDAVAQDTEYCQMVSEGHWPDYKGNYDEVCK